MIVILQCAFLLLVLVAQASAIPVFFENTQETLRIRDVFKAGARSALESERVSTGWSAVWDKIGDEPDLRRVSEVLTKEAAEWVDFLTLYPTPFTIMQFVKTYGTSFITEGKFGGYKRFEMYFESDQVQTATKDQVTDIQDSLVGPSSSSMMLQNITEVLESRQVQTKQTKLIRQGICQCSADECATDWGNIKSATLLNYKLASIKHVFPENLQSQVADALISYVMCGGEGEYQTPLDSNKISLENRDLGGKCECFPSSPDCACDDLSFDIVAEPITRKNQAFRRVQSLCVELLENDIRRFSGNFSIDVPSRCKERIEYRIGSVAYANCVDYDSTFDEVVVFQTTRLGDTWFDLAKENFLDDKIQSLDDPSAIPESDATELGLSAQTCNAFWNAEASIVASLQQEFQKVEQFSCPTKKAALEAIETPLYSELAARLNVTLLSSVYCADGVTFDTESLECRGDPKGCGFGYNVIDGLTQRCEDGVVIDIDLCNCSDHLASAGCQCRANTQCKVRDNFSTYCEGAPGRDSRGVLCRESGMLWENNQCVHCPEGTYVNPSGTENACTETCATGRFWSSFTKTCNTKLFLTTCEVAPEMCQRHMCGNDNWDKEFMKEACDGSVGGEYSCVNCAACTGPVADPLFRPLTASSGVCGPACGNAELDAGETCDNAPNCTDRCRCAPGYAAVAGENRCVRKCGNGNRNAEAGEECDSSPGCTAECRCDAPKYRFDDGTQQCVLACDPMGQAWPTAANASSELNVRGKECSVLDAPIGAACRGCLCAVDHSPTPDATCQPLCGNLQLDAALRFGDGPIERNATLCGAYISPKGADGASCSKDAPCRLTEELTGNVCAFPGVYRMLKQQYDVLNAKFMTGDLRIMGTRASAADLGGLSVSSLHVEVCDGVENCKADCSGCEQGYRYAPEDEQCVLIATDNILPPTITYVCGNDVLEPGEECEASLSNCCVDCKIDVDCRLNFETNSAQNRMIAQVDLSNMDDQTLLASDNQGLNSIEIDHTIANGNVWILESTFLEPRIAIGKSAQLSGEWKAGKAVFQVSTGSGMVDVDGSDTKNVAPTAPPTVGPATQTTVMSVESTTPGLSAGIIALIVVAALVCLALTGGAIWFFVFRRRNADTHATPMVDSLAKLEEDHGYAPDAHQIANASLPPPITNKSSRRRKSSRREQQTDTQYTALPASAAGTQRKSSRRKKSSRRQEPQQLNYVALPGEAAAPTNGVGIIALSLAVIAMLSLSGLEVDAVKPRFSDGAAVGESDIIIFMPLGQPLSDIDVKLVQGGRLYGVFDAVPLAPTIRHKIEVTRDCQVDNGMCGVYSTCVDGACVCDEGFRHGDIYEDYCVGIVRPADENATPFIALDTMESAFDVRTGEINLGQRLFSFTYEDAETQQRPIEGLENAKYFFPDQFTATVDESCSTLTNEYEFTFEERIKTSSSLLTKAGFETEMEVVGSLGDRDCNQDNGDCGQLHCLSAAGVGICGCRAGSFLSSDGRVCVTEATVDCTASSCAHDCQFSPDGLNVKGACVCPEQHVVVDTFQCRPLTGCDTVDPVTGQKPCADPHTCQPLPDGDFQCLCDLSHSCSLKTACIRPCDNNHACCQVVYGSEEYLDAPVAYGYFSDLTRSDKRIFRLRHLMNAIAFNGDQAFVVPESFGIAIQEAACIEGSMSVTTTTHSVSDVSREMQKSQTQKFDASVSVNANGIPDPNNPSRNRTRIQDGGTATYLPAQSGKKQGPNIGLSGGFSKDKKETQRVRFLDKSNAKVVHVTSEKRSIWASLEIPLFNYTGTLDANLFESEFIETVAALSAVLYDMPERPTLQEHAVMQQQLSDFFAQWGVIIVSKGLIGGKMIVDTVSNADSFSNLVDRTNTFDQNTCFNLGVQGTIPAPPVEVGVDATYEQCNQEANNQASSIGGGSGTANTFTTVEKYGTMQPNCGGGPLTTLTLIEPEVSFSMSVFFPFDLEETVERYMMGYRYCDGEGIAVNIGGGVLSADAPSGADQRRCICFDGTENCNRLEAPGVVLGAPPTQSGTTQLVGASLRSFQVFWHNVQPFVGQNVIDYELQFWFTSRDPIYGNSKRRVTVMFRDLPARVRLQDAGPSILLNVGYAEFDKTEGKMGITVHHKALLGPSTFGNSGSHVVNHHVAVRPVAQYYRNPGSRVSLAVNGGGFNDNANAVVLESEQFMSDWAEVVQPASCKFPTLSEIDAFATTYMQEVYKNRTPRRFRRNNLPQFLYEETELYEAYERRYANEVYQRGTDSKVADTFATLKTRTSFITQNTQKTLVEQRQADARARCGSYPAPWEHLNNNLLHDMFECELPPLFKNFKYEEQNGKTFGCSAYTSDFFNEK